MRHLVILRRSAITPERPSARNVTASAANAGANAPSKINAPPNGEPAGIGTKATVKKQIHIGANASAKNTNSELADETRTVGSRDSAIMQAASDVRERCRGQGTNYTTQAAKPAQSVPGNAVTIIMPSGRLPIDSVG